MVKVQVGGKGLGDCGGGQIVATRAAPSSEPERVPARLGVDDLNVVRKKAGVRDREDPRFKLR